jgi:Tol biopolymer transport system component
MFDVGIPEELGKRSSRRGILLTPDGRSIIVASVESTANSVWIRPIHALEFEPIEGTASPYTMALSPDGQSITTVDYDAGEIHRVPLAGGISTTVAKLTDNIQHLAWGDNDDIVFSAWDGGLMRVPSGGGDVELLTDVGPEETHKQATFVPGSNAMVLVIGENSTAESPDDKLAILKPDGTLSITPIAGASPTVTPDGNLLFYSHGALWVVPFDLENIEIAGDPVPIIDDVYYEFRAAFAVSDEGTLIYQRDSALGDHELVWVDGDGIEESTGFTGARYRFPKVSPDGDTLALSVDSPYGWDLWTFSLPTGTPNRLTRRGPVLESSRVWAPDGKRIFFEAGGESDIYQVSVLGDESEELLKTSLQHLYPFSITPNGEQLVLSISGPGARGRQDIGVIDVESPGEPEYLLRTEYWESHPIISPDGRWLAYMSNRNGDQQIYVRRFDAEENSAALQVSRGGGWLPEWNGDGSELYFWDRDAGAIMAVSLTFDNGIDASEPIHLFDTASYDFHVIGAYDYDPTRDRFLMIKNPPLGSTGDELVLIQNWQELLTRSTQ